LTAVGADDSWSTLSPLLHHDRELYKQRNCIERMFGRLKINRSIATRYDQLANSFLGMVHIATARYWLKFVHAA
jgi:transposase